MAASKRSIHLATFCYGGLAHAAYMRSVLELRPACARRGVDLHLDIGAGEALIGRGRATAMAKFLAGDAAHLLFVDADIGFEPDAVFRLLDSGLDVVGGIYPRKSPRSGDEVDELPAGTSQQAGGFRTVASLGAGFLLISRAAASRITGAYPQLKARLGDLHGAGVAEAAMVFDSFVERGSHRYLADHQAFCRRWRDLGGLVWADAAGGLIHVGALSAPAPSPQPPAPPMDLRAAQALFRGAEAHLTEGRLEAAETILRSMVEAGAAGPDVQYMLGYALLAQGRYKEGFQRYEARRSVPAFKIALPPFPTPRWRGEPLVGKRLLVWPEQGFGDQIMFSRFALALAGAGASVAMAAPRPLVRLLEGTAVDILPADGPIELSGYDYVTLSGDLPHLCGATIDALPPPWPVKAIATPTQGHIGVMTNGDPKHANDAERSLPPDQAARLLSLPGALSLDPHDTGAQDFQATADLIAGLDLVITVDTAIAHLAGSMGKPIWILLPHRRTDWRWLRNRNDSPWYPSARLFRRGPTQNWGELVNAVLVAEPGIPVKS